MNWFKKKLNKLFKDDIEPYDENEAYYTEDQEEPYFEEERKTKNKSAFRFPLISDDEIMPQHHKQERVSRVERSSLPSEERPLELPKHLQHSISKVYDVEAQGIRDLLESRQKRTGNSTVLRRPKKESRKLSVPRTEEAFLTKKPVREEKPVNREYVNPLENRKRFVPTDVPSPVYGFQKPKPIQQLVANKQTEAATTAEEKVLPSAEQPVFVDVHTSNNVVSNEASAEPFVVDNSRQQLNEQASESELREVETAVELMIEAVPDTQTEVEVNPSLYQNNDALIIAEEAEENHVAKEDMEEQLSDMQVQHLTIENSTIHIGQLNVEQAQQNEFVQVKTEESQPVSTGSRLPFNVLMLKSDKEKLLAKEIFQEQLRKKKPVQKVNDEPNAADESVATTETTSEIFIPFLQVEAERKDSSATISTQAEENIKNKHTVDVSEQKETETVLDEVCNEQHDVVNEQIEMLIEQSEAVPEQTEIPNEQNKFTFEQNEERPTPIEQPEQPAEQLQEIQSEPKNSENTIEPIDEAELTPKFNHHYEKPPLSFLLPPEEKTEDWGWMDEQGERLIRALSYFHIEAEIVSIVQGPAVTQFEITVAHGTKVSKVRGLADDIKLALAARDIRIDAPIPGKHSIGIEIPNRVSRAVRLSEVTNSEVFQTSDSPLEAALGLDLAGQPVTIDLRKMPHGLIAGATGSGKSVCINSILVSLLYKSAPHELKLMLIDPKMVELAPFNNIPHLVSPVITDVKAATAALKWAVEEMERRYQLFMHAGVRDLTRFNQQAEKSGQHGHKLPYILIVIDELADLMMMSPADVEEAICRIAQKARACGIHLIVATQRPSVDVITGLIKSNIPTRIAFAVSSAVDSRTILDMQGAERLLGRGDMLYLGNGMPAPVRLQGTFVTDDEIEEIISYVRTQGEPDYFFQHDELLKKAEIIEEQDELFEEVCRYVFEQGTASTSSIQRRYKIGYNRAARLVDMLERNGFVSEQRGSKPREVFITESDIISMFE